MRPRLAKSLVWLCLAPAVHAGQDSRASASAPATGAVQTIRSAEDQQRFNDLLALVEGQNTVQARRTGARELLRAGWPDVPARFAQILTSANNRAAKIAIADALAETPQAFDGSLIEPLVSMLGDAEAETRQAAAGALVASRHELTIPRLRSLLSDATAAPAARQAAVDTLGRMTNRDAIAALVEALKEPGSPLAGAALSAIEHATAMEFATAADAQRWWEETRHIPLSEWQTLQVERLVRQSRSASQRVRDLEQRLATALRDAYLRVAEAERPALLNSYLADPSETVRRLGLELVQSQLNEGKTCTAETRDAMRQLLAASEAPVRSAAARVVASLRDRADEPRYLQLLAGERETEVRAALVYGLGYIGGADSVPALLALVDRPEPAADEAITSLGRLAERDVLDDATTAVVADALLRRCEAVGAEDAGGRERLIRAMSRVADARFAPYFAAAAASAEAAGVRLAAIRGLAALAVAPPAGASASSQPTSNRAGSAELRRQCADALPALIGDGDVTVRRAAVEALGQVGTTDAHLQSLSTRLAAAQESDDAVRTAAWRGVVRLLSTRGPREIEEFVGRLPENGPQRLTYSLELLRLAESQLGGAGQAEARGRVRGRIAGFLVELSQGSEAVTAASAGLRDLAEAKSTLATGAACELARLSLRFDRLDAGTVAVLAECGAAIERAAVWTALKAELERMATRESADRLSAATAALIEAAPPFLADAALEEAKALHRRAALLKGGAADEQVLRAIECLRQLPTDEAARATILEHGERAAPAVSEALREAVRTGAGDDFERALVDLLKLLNPNWSGYPPDASPAEKLRVLDSASV